MFKHFDICCFGLKHKTNRMCCMKFINSQTNFYYEQITCMSDKCVNQCIIKPYGTIKFPHIFIELMITKVDIKLISRFLILIKNQVEWCNLPIFDGINSISDKNKSYLFQTKVIKNQFGIFLKFLTSVTCKCCLQHNRASNVRLAVKSCELLLYCSTNLCKSYFKIEKSKLI